MIKKYDNNILNIKNKLHFLLMISSFRYCVIAINYFNIFFISSLWCGGESAALSSTQHAMPPEIGGKWGTECLITRFPLPALLCAGYNVNLKKK